MVRLRSIISSLLAAGVLVFLPFVLSGVSHAEPLACTGTCYHIENTGPGGCLKDEGDGSPYEVATCSTASNFNQISGYTYQGIQFYEYKDGSGYCLTDSETASPDYAIAKPCGGAGTKSQEWLQFTTTISSHAVSLYNLVYNTQTLYLEKSAASPYDAVQATYTNNGDQLWELITTS